MDKINFKIISKPPQFQWDSITVGLILNLFWYGYILSPLGGLLSQKFGGSTTFGVSMAITGILTILSPITLEWSFSAFLACRGLVGMFEGFSSASTAAIFSKWIPKKELHGFMSATMNGIYVGAAIIYPFCGFVGYYWGWRMIFYGIGVICTVWSVIWLILVQNEPSNDELISKTELSYILEGTKNVQKKIVNNYPYRNIFASSAFWALSIGKFDFGWSSSFITVNFPLYIKDKTQKDVEDVGFMSCVPEIFFILFIPVAGLLIGKWQNYTNFKPTRIHKIIISVDLIGCAILFTIIPFTDDFIVTSICFVLIKALMSYNKVVLELVTVNMAPNHSSLVSGLSLSCQTIGYIVAQNFIGFIVRSDELNEWNTCFLTSSGVLMASAVIFIFYGSSEPQPWSISNTPDIDKNSDCVEDKEPI